jgi:hypothetical protein
VIVHQLCCGLKSKKIIIVEDGVKRERERGGGGWDETYYAQVSTTELRHLESGPDDAGSGSTSRA